KNARHSRAFCYFTFPFRVGCGMIPTHEPWRRGARNSKERIILMEPIQVGLLCILPPVIAIGLALITKEVLSSLMLGILSGTLIYALNTGAGPISAVSS